MNENIAIQNNFQEDLQGDSFNSGVDDNGHYTATDNTVSGVSVDLFPGGTNADNLAEQPGSDPVLSDVATGDSALSVSSGDVVGSEHVYISLADLEAYQASTAEVQTVSSGDLVGIEEKIDDLNYNTTALLFFIVFAWCYERIKNGIRSMNGIGLK